MNREAIHSAVFARLGTASGFALASRRLRHWSTLSPAEQPALFMSTRRQTAQQRETLPPLWTLSIDLYLYVRAAGDGRDAPSALLNPLIDTVEALFAPDPATARQTLGGLVTHAWIRTVETDEGSLGDQAVAILTLDLLVA